MFHNLTDSNDKKIDIIIQTLCAIQEDKKQSDQKIKMLFESSQRELSTKISQELITQSTQLGLAIGKQIGEHTEKIESALKKTDEKIQQSIDETKMLGEKVTTLSSDFKCLTDFRLKYEPEIAKVKVIASQLIDLGILKTEQLSPYDKTGDTGTTYSHL